MQDTLSQALSETLSDAVRPVIRDEVLAALPEAIRKATRKEWLTLDEVEKLTGWSRRTLHYLREQRKLAYSQRGRLILISHDSLDELIAEGWVPRAA